MIHFQNKCSCKRKAWVPTESEFRTSFWLLPFLGEKANTRGFLSAESLKGH